LSGKSEENGAISVAGTRHIREGCIFPKTETIYFPPQFFATYLFHLEHLPAILSSIPACIILI